MTREMAVLGVPTISTYNDELLSVDRYLVENGYMLHLKSDIDFDVKSLIQSLKEGRISSDLLDKGKLAYNILKDTTNKVINWW